MYVFNYTHCGISTMMLDCRVDTPIFINEGMRLGFLSESYIICLVGRPK